MAHNHTLSFAEFQDFVSDALAVEKSALSPEAYFFEDLAVNSMTLVELVLRFEIELGIKIPIEQAWNIQTVGDAYRFYTTQISVTEQSRPVNSLSA
jgi:acyl carrier protein